MPVKSKSALITGCSPGGIGHALVLELQSQGFRVFATARSLSKVAALEVDNVEVLELDVTQPESIAAVKDEIARRTGGRLDYLINNAGAWLESPAIETEISSIKSMYDVNVFGPMEMVRQFTPLLFPVQGIIVNIGSILGIMPYPLTAAYNGSKAALAQYSETLRLELEPLNIRVITVVSGQVMTNLPSVPQFGESSIYTSLDAALRERTKTHQEKTMTAKAYASALVKNISGSSPKPWFWKGTNSTITWLVSTFAPKTAFDFLMKKMSGLGENKTQIFNKASVLWSKQK